jgi:7-cyano-7-deazaguanine synthase
MRAVALLSGGLDSTTSLFQAVYDGYSDVIAVTCQYGSKHNARELEAAVKIADKFCTGHSIVNLPDIFRGADSALMDEVTMPHMTYNEIAEEEGPSPTVVPFRNGNLISVATAIAVTNDAEAVYVGMHAEDARNWAYPDCTPEFLGAMANAVFVGTYQKVRLVFPLIHMMKSGVVTRAALLNVPARLTYSCYEGRRKHCGLCPTCVERVEAFNEAGYIDPAEYEIDIRQAGERWPV